MEKTPTRRPGIRTDFRPFRLLFLVALALGLAVAGISQWRVIARPVAFHSPQGAAVAFRKAYFFDQFAPFDLARDFYFTTRQGDSFSVPLRVSGDLWAASGNDDSLLLVFNHSFSVLKSSESGESLKRTFSGALPTRGQTIALLPGKAGYHAIAYRRLSADGKGELRAFLLRDLEVKELPYRQHTLEISKPLLYFSAGLSGDSTVLTFTIDEDGELLSYSATYTEEGGFGEAFTLSFVAGPQAMASCPAGEGESRLYLLSIDPDEDSEIACRQFSDGVWNTVGSLKDPWVSENSVSSLTASAEGSSIFLVALADELRYTSYTPLEPESSPADRSRFEPLVDTSRLTDVAGHGLWSYLFPALLLLTIFTLFSRNRRGPEPPVDLGALTKAIARTREPEKTAKSVEAKGDEPGAPAEVDQRDSEEISVGPARQAEPIEPVGEEEK